MNDFTHRKATIKDLRTIVSLLLEDEFGRHREVLTKNLDQCYIDAFHKIDADPNQYLMVVQSHLEIIGTCHLTIMPSLTFKGSTRMQIEAVRILQKYRRRGVGKWMMNAAIEYAQLKGALIVQLTTHKNRLEAKKFYESIGFESTHEGMKMYLRK
ncbi:MAG: GNAT family N-acetyltransferase [Alphaproteobacteria bacterium]|nr:GNAT family N-acetyltransferase [Alphaproteobacteria bacterium]